MFLLGKFDVALMLIFVSSGQKVRKNACQVLRDLVSPG
ncbi:hypothetical protein L579_2322 [Pantoea sp. AS-PWVM4]|nr:hypothetical protein L579_2322 [Pantoea sp. AS-PWVM4]